ncbi:MAG TPA: hypothetical protein VMS08_02310 [Candidatus Saccharimonadia bacterium]|nr:hypothetical protein [Candidatus Saccharimonadia bacterium]
MGGLSLGGLIYIIIGLFVASGHGYLVSVGTLNGLISAIIAVLFWPLILLGADLHLSL